MLLTLAASACDRPAQPGGTASTAPATTGTPPGATTGTGTAAAGTTAPPVATSPEVFAVFNQPAGAIRVRLATAEAPRLCMAFILLAERGYFTGQRWTDFSPVVRQLGDSPPLFTVPREFSPKLLFDKGGNLCASNTSDDDAARAKPNRIFITVKEQDRWNLKYVVFGRVESGLSVAQALTDGENIRSIEIEGDTSALRARFAKDIPAWEKAIAAAVKPAAK